MSQEVLPSDPSFMKPRSIFSLLLLAGLVCIVSCSRVQGHGGEENRLSLTGSSTIAPLMTVLAARFEQEHPGVRIDVQSGGSGRGIADARNGVADFGMVSRSLRAEEKDLLAWPIARDGVSMIVNQKNPLANLSREQIRSIYTGKIRNWSHLGWEGGPIVVVHEAEGRATLEVFLDHFGLQNEEVRADVIAGENEHAIKTVANDPRAIGYVSIGTAEEDIRQGVSIRLLALDGVEAAKSKVAEGQYPMLRELNLVALQEPVGLAAEFLAYVRSAAADDLIRAQSFTPLAH